MAKLDSQQLRPLFDAVYEMNTARDHADFATAVTTALHRLIPSDMCQLHVMDRASQRILHHTFPHNPFNAEELAYFGAHQRENPFISHYERTGETRARRLSDVTDLAVFRRSEYARRCHRRLGIRYTLALPITIDVHTIAGLVFNRRRTDFSLRHCALLDAFSPHFLLAWKKHRTPWRRAKKARPTVRERLRQLGLTPSETDVLFWMTEGKQNREIATILGRSLGTVQEHVANLVRKLGQENRHVATVFALRYLGGE